VLRTAAVGLAVALACVLAGCTARSTPRPAAVSFASTICAHPDRVVGKVRAFVAAYDAGQSGLAERFFAPAPRFRWYSEPGRREGSAAYDRSTLDAYLARREASGDDLELVRVTPSDAGNFAFTVRRFGETLLSKGALDCRSGLFAVWSLGPNPGP
jgi:hypothetical protein